MLSKLRDSNARKKREAGALNASENKLSHMATVRESDRRQGQHTSCPGAWFRHSDKVKCSASVISRKFITVESHLLIIYDPGERAGS